MGACRQPRSPISDEDRSTLTTWIRSSTVSAGHAERAAIVLACAGGLGDLGGGPEARGVAADGHQVAGPVRPPRDRRPRRRAAQRPAQDHRRRGDHRRDPGPAARAPRGDPLVDAAAGPAPRRRRRHGRPGLAPVPRPAVAAGDVQVQHRPGARGQGPRRGRAVPRPARQGDRAVRRREEPDPGPRPDRADAAPAPRAARAGHPRLQAQRHDHAVRGPRDRHRQGDRPVLRAPRRGRLPRLPQAGREGLPAARSCTWSSTTTTPTSTPTSRRGWRRTGG